MPSSSATPVPVPTPDREAAKARVRAKVAAEKALPAIERVMNTLHATHTHADAQALLDSIRADIEREVRAEQAAQIERLRARVDEVERRYTFDTAELKRTVDYFDAQSKRRKSERDALKQRLHEAAMARVWTNEDGKKFVFVDDIKGPLLSASSAEVTS